MAALILGYILEPELMGLKQGEEIWRSRKRNVVMSACDASKPSGTVPVTRYHDYHTSIWFSLSIYDYKILS